ncbi:MAG: capsular biosynthesis protein [Bacteroidia bacterium]|nr:capsular biosynthesis protein [Bacteroidia bacterium]
MGLFSNIFNRKTELGKKSSTSSFVNPIQVEFHSHLIYGVDDGCEVIDQSIAILKKFADLGMRKVITTPHVMSDFYKNSQANIYPLRDEIRKRLSEENIQIEFDAAAEYMVDEGFEKKIEEGNLLTFGKDNKHVLIELPFMTEPPNLNAVLFKLQIAGYTPILAHPERYMYYGNEREKFHELKDRGILLQLNILSCLGYYSKPVADVAAYLVNNKLIDLVGSDVHHIRHMQILPDALEHKIYRKVCELELLNNYL